MAPPSPTTTNPFPNDDPNDSDSHQFTAEQRFHGAYSYALVHMRSNMRLENPAFMIPTYSMLVAWKPTITKMEWAALAHDIKAGSEDFAPHDCIRDGVGVLIDDAARISRGEQPWFLPGAMLR